MTYQYDTDDAPLQTQPIQHPPIEDLRGATPKTPYPARRKYKWASPYIDMPYEDAIQLFLTMRKQSTPQRNPQRWQSFTLAAESVEFLHRSQNVQTFRGDRLHKLLCKAALAADWCPDLNAIQRLRAPVPVKTDDEGSFATMLLCRGCGQARPWDSFLTKMTDAQRRRWGLPNTSTRKVRSRLCSHCRDAKASILRQRANRKEAQQVERSYTQAILDNDIEQAETLFEQHWGRMLHMAIGNTRSQIKRAAHEPTREFLEHKLQALLAAQEVQQAAAESGNAARYILPAADWTIFLSDHDRRALIEKHIRTVLERREDNISGRHPTI
jgi:hypothetical protein